MAQRNLSIAVICPSEIAERRFLPALADAKGIEFAGMGFCAPGDIYGVGDNAERERIRTSQRERAEKCVRQYGGKVFDGYEGAFSDESVDAVYIPLPPALHYAYAMDALSAGKHVLVEKPATCSREETSELVRIAKDKGLALHENYMFVFHDQIKEIDAIIGRGEIGEVRLYRICFGFPKRAAADFRYNKALGGGALIDAGGYTLKYASLLLGEDVCVEAANLNYVDGVAVDMYGSGTLANATGVVAQVAFGMDNAYKCELEVWGSAGTLSTGRVLTAPSGFVPSATIQDSEGARQVELPADDTFRKSIEYFVDCIRSAEAREAAYDDILCQSRIVEDFDRMANEACR